MKKEALYLICPDCHIESAIRSKYGNNAHFLTALGTVFDISEFEYADEVNQFIQDETISEIVIVNDLDCTFIRNTVYENQNHNTVAEKVLLKLKNKNIKDFKDLSFAEQQRLLVRLNIYRQANDLLGVAFVGSKIRDAIIKISGLIYNRVDSTFDKFNLNLESSRQHHL